MLRRAVILLALLGCCTFVHAATLNDTSRGSASGGTTTVSTEALAVTAGDLVACGIKFEGATSTATFDTGASTPTFTEANPVEHHASTNDHNGASGYWTATSTGTVTPRVVLGAARTFLVLSCYSFTPASGTTLALGNVASAQQGENVTAASSGSASATAAGATVVFFHLYGGEGLTAGSGWTEPAEFNVSAAQQSEYQLQTGAGSLTGDGTLSVGNFSISQMAIFNEANNASLEQEGFQWGVDDGDEASHTFEAAQDTNISIADTQSRLLRVLIDSPEDPAAIAFALRYQKNGSGGYAAVPVGASTADSITNQNVAASADDAAESSAGTNTITGTTIGASLDNTAEWAGMRFTGITIPAGATITAASVGVVPSGTGEDEPLVTVYLEAADDCAAFTTDANGISSRSRTTGVAWSSTNLAASGATYHSTPDLAADFQAVIDRAGWASGNDVCVLIQGGATTTRDLTIEAQDLGPNTNPPRLSVSWTEPNEVYIATSANIAAGGEATTARLTAPTGKTSSDYTAGLRWDDENGTDTINIASDFYTELEWLIALSAAPVAADYFEFRVYQSADVLNTYTLDPRWTIPGAGGASGLLRRRRGN